MENAEIFSLKYITLVKWAGVKEGPGEVLHVGRPTRQSCNPVRLNPLPKAIARGPVMGRGAGSVQLHGMLLAPEVTYVCS